VVVAGLIEAEEGGPERSRSLGTRGVRWPVRWPADPTIVPSRPPSCRSSGVRRPARWPVDPAIVPYCVVRWPGWDPQSAAG
jgi:hypothetical protein